MRFGVQLDESFLKDVQFKDYVSANRAVHGFLLRGRFSVLQAAAVDGVHRAFLALPLVRPHPPTLREPRRVFITTAGPFCVTARCWCCTTTRCVPPVWNFRSATKPFAYASVSRAPAFAKRASSTSGN